MIVTEHTSASRHEAHKRKQPPTPEQFDRYQKAWDYFNEALFNGQLEPCLLNFSSHRGSYGYFCPRRWKKDDQHTHEISLNPNTLGRPLADTMSTLVHEMVHQWQDDFGTPSRRSYHNSEWADKMEQVGLIPSHTGEPGGAKTGQRMSHYIDPNGNFAKALARMPHEFALPWLTGEVEARIEKPKPPKKVKLTCPECEVNVWIAADVDRCVMCGECDERFLTKDELKERKHDEGETD